MGVKEGGGDGNEGGWWCWETRKVVVVMGVKDGGDGADGR